MSMAHLEWGANATFAAMILGTVSLGIGVAQASSSETKRDHFFL